MNGGRRKYAFFCALVFIYVLISCRNETLQLTLVFVSDRVPDIEKFSWMPLLSIQSFVSTFSLPRRDVQVSARFYISCERAEAKRSVYKPTLLMDSKVSIEHTEYTEIFVNLRARFAAAFNEIDIFCSSQLADALCHMKETMRPDSLFFLLEHDWVILPSQFEGSLPSIGRTLRSHGAAFEYALLQRGDRLTKKWRAGSALEKGRLYSNNPFLATGSFLEKLTNQGFCTYNVSSWEKNVESYCKRRKQCKLAVVRPKRRTSLYHMDGRFLSFAANHSLGPLFDGSLLPKGSSSSIQLSPERVISAIASMCASLPDPCSPYFLRHEFAAKIHEFARRRGFPETASSEYMVSEYFGSTHAAKLFLHGQFPHQVLQG